jgi:transposase
MEIQMDKFEIEKLYSEFNILYITEGDDNLNIILEPKENKFSCPYCQTSSDKVNQKYDKVVQDLSIEHKNVLLTIKNKLYFCYNKDCPHTTFNPIFELFKNTEKKTNRLINHILDLKKDKTYQQVADILNGEGIKVSKTTIYDITSKYKTGE